MKEEDPYEISSEEELRRELSRLFRSAYRHEVPIGPTWVVEYDDRPSVEIVAIGLRRTKIGTGPWIVSSS